MFYLYNKKFKVTNEELKRLRNEYFIDLAKKKLEITNGQELNVKKKKKNVKKEKNKKKLNKKDQNKKNLNI